jgi:hypothetical protein
LTNQRREFGTILQYERSQTLRAARARSNHFTRSSFQGKLEDGRLARCMKRTKISRHEKASANIDITSRLKYDLTTQTSLIAPRILTKHPSISENYRHCYAAQGFVQRGLLSKDSVSALQRCISENILNNIQNRWDFRYALNHAAPGCDISTSLIERSSAMGYISGDGR